MLQQKSKSSLQISISRKERKEQKRKVRKGSSLTFANFAKTFALFA
jgi:hypothetical protein